MHAGLQEWFGAAALSSGNGELQAASLVLGCAGTQFYKIYEPACFFSGCRMKCSRWSCVWTTKGMCCRQAAAKSCVVVTACELKRCRNTLTQDAPPSVDNPIDTP